MPDPITIPPPSNNFGGCFDVNEVQSNCEIVWIRMNLHFFLDANCEGTIDPLGNENIPAEEAYQVAEAIIEDANLQLGADMYKQWSQIPLWSISVEKPIQCVPIRYVLSGVFVHCDNNWQSHGGNEPNWYRNNYGVNTNTEFNGFFVEWPGNSNGQADAYGGAAFTLESFVRDGFNHEMGHVLNLYHTFIVDDDCDDTPNVRYRIDYNCDGDVTDTWTSNGGLSEFTIHRGTWCHPTHPEYDGIGDPLDYDGDGVANYQNRCDPQASELEPGAILAGCMPEPPCSWDYVTNNIMHYSCYADCCGAFTEDQITRMLNYLNVETACQYVETIVDECCPPPAPNIHILPNEVASVADDCSFCFQLGASMGDEKYKLDFFTPSGTLQYTTTWKEGPANLFCISYFLINPTTYKHGFLSGIEYTVEFTVENACGDQKMESLSFVLPALPQGCGQVEEEDKIRLDGLFPNPVVNVLNVDYTVNIPGHLEVWLIPISNAQNQTLIYSEHILSSSTYHKTFSLSILPQGIYYLLLDLDGAIDYVQIVKQ